MTDTDSHVSTPGGADETAAVDPVACFDRDGDAVFATACRLTAGDRRFADDIVNATFARLQRGEVGADRRSLIVAAHHVYLADDRASDEFWDEPVVAALDERRWTDGRWDHALATVRGMTGRERAATNLSVLEGMDRRDAATVLSCTEDEVDALVESGARLLRGTGSTDTVAEVLRHAEIWFGDDERDDVRVSLGAPSRRPAEPARDSEPAARPRVRVTRAAVIGAAVALVAIVVGLVWIASLPDDEPIQSVETVLDPSDASIEVDATADTAVTVVDGRASDTVNGLPVTVSVTAVGGALTEPEVLFMGSGLTDPSVVVPDAIVRYSDGKIGLSWTSPCNRPAIAVAVTNTATGAAVELTTGEFPIVSCIGMPERWTAVVLPSRPLPEGDIVPIGPGGIVLVGYPGGIEAGAPGGTAEPLTPDAGYGSALVDDANQPWVYGLGCSSRSARYLSPIGAIFEIRRADELDPNSYSSSDAIVCNDLATRPVLTGPLGAVTPLGEATPGVPPTACQAPSGSLIDVPSARPYNSKFYDGDWSRWDGCLVRSDVVFSESLFETCAGQDVRVITFAADLGAQIADDTPTLSYVRDPGNVVAGERPSLITYVAPSTDMYDTGLRYGDQQLWRSGDTDAAVYVQIDGIFERWPQLTEPVSCA